MRSYRCSQRTRGLRHTVRPPIRAREHLAVPEPELWLEHDHTKPAATAAETTARASAVRTPAGGAMPEI
jgi:hypothetical protein